MHKQFLHIVVSLFSLLCLISLPMAGEQKQNDGNGTHHIYIVQLEWHTGIILNTNAINPKTWNDEHLYSQKRYVDVSWGDEKFYQANGRPVLLAARAVLWPTQSAVRIFPFSNSVRNSYGQKARIMKIQLSDEQFDSLTQFISESFKRTDSGSPVPSTIHGKSNYFFIGTKKYHLFRTCNTWVAMALKHAGFDIRSCLVLNANQLFRQLEKIPVAEYL